MSSKRRLALIMILSGGFIFLFQFITISDNNYELIKKIQTAGIFNSTQDLYISHLQTPEAVKAIYVTSCTASNQDRRNELVEFIDKTEINSMVIDIKDYTGTVSFEPTYHDLKPAWLNSPCPVTDMRQFIRDLHSKEIYVIGRISVFQDPFIIKQHPDWAVLKKDRKSIWKDYRGMGFIDPGSTDAWRYNLNLALDAYKAGFDEINFDYIRFPSDGPLHDAYYPYLENREKSEVLEEFFKYLQRNLKPKGIVLSGDFFGMICTDKGNLVIGQILEKALPYFDYIAPMVYPSHYPYNFHGLGDPNLHPYEIIHTVLNEAVKRAHNTSTHIKTLESFSISPGVYAKPYYDASKIRPWLQDFDYGGIYDIEEVQAQIRAAYDSGVNSWMFWNARNQYTEKAFY